MVQVSKCNVERCRVSQFAHRNYLFSTVSCETTCKSYALPIAVIELYANDFEQCIQEEAFRPIYGFCLRAVTGIHCSKILVCNCNSSYWYSVEFACSFEPCPDQLSKQECCNVQSSGLWKQHLITLSTQFVNLTIYSQVYWLTVDHV